MHAARTDTLTRFVRLLLDKGALPDDHDLYLACFGDDVHASLRLLLDVAPAIAESTALSAPISTRDIEGVRLLLQAGADPNRLPPAELYGAQYADDLPWPAAYAAIRSGCSVELIHLLLEHGADPNATGPDGQSPHQLALRQGAVELAEMLRRYGARPDARDVEVFLAACLQADRRAAEDQLNRGPVHLDQLTDADQATTRHPAETGNTAAWA